MTDGGDMTRALLLPWQAQVRRRWRSKSLGVQEMTILYWALLGTVALISASPSCAQDVNGRGLYLQRCSMCHGSDLKGTGPLANKSDPPAPDLTTSAFKSRLSAYPGVIVSSIILRRNGDLIPRTLRNNGVKLPEHSWSINDLRDINQYMSSVIKRGR